MCPSSGMPSPIVSEFRYSPYYTLFVRIVKSAVKPAAGVRGTRLDRIAAERYVRSPPNQASDSVFRNPPESRMARAVPHRDSSESVPAPRLGRNLLIRPDPTL